MRNKQVIKNLIEQVDRLKFVVEFKEQLIQDIVKSTDKNTIDEPRTKLHDQRWEIVKEQQIIRKTLNEIEI